MPMAERLLGAFKSFFNNLLKTPPPGFFNAEAIIADNSEQSLKKIESVRQTLCNFISPHWPHVPPLSLSDFCFKYSFIQ